MRATRSKTASQVREELAAARAAGMVTSGELDYPPDVPASTGKTGEQVQAEMREARVRGEMKSGELDYPPVASDLSAK